MPALSKVSHVMVLGFILGAIFMLGLIIYLILTALF